MITLQEAIKIAENEKFVPILAQITEYHDRYDYFSALQKWKKEKNQ